jgi:signal transduction histidine kinase
MKRPLSLRSRLVGLTLLAVALVWLLTAFVTWRETRHELEELLAHPPSTSAAHLTKERNEIAGKIAEQLLKPMLYGLPALALLLVIVIGFALAPLRQLARDVAERGPDRLDPLPLESLPTEVAPLVTRLNSLFADIVRSLENERRFTADAAHELRTPLAATAPRIWWCSC